MSGFELDDSWDAHLVLNSSDNQQRPTQQRSSGSTVGHQQNNFGNMTTSQQAGSHLVGQQQGFNSNPRLNNSGSYPVPQQAGIQRHHQGNYNNPGYNNSGSYQTTQQVGNQSGGYQQSYGQGGHQQGHYGRPQYNNSEILMPNPGQFEIPIHYDPHDSNYYSNNGGSGPTAWLRGKCNDAVSKAKSLAFGPPGPTPEELLRKEEEEMKLRMAERRRKAFQEESAMTHSRDDFQTKTSIIDANTKKIQNETQRLMEAQKIKIEQLRQLQREENERELERKKQQLRERGDEKATKVEEYYDKRNKEQDDELKLREFDRIRMTAAQNHEISQIHAETIQKGVEFQKKQEEERLRREVEDAEFAEKLRKIEIENREKAEKHQKLWEEQMRKQKEQYDYMMKQMAYKRWTMNMEMNFENRLNYLRSSVKSIKQKYEAFADSLLTVLEYLKNTPDPDSRRFEILKVHVESLRNILENQRDLMSEEVMNLQDMQDKTGWSFLPDIETSLTNVQESCEQMLDEISNKYVFLDQDHLKSGTALGEMNRIFENVMKAYSQIPNMSYLKQQHDLKNESSGDKEEHRTEDGQVYTIEEPED